MNFKKNRDSIILIGIIILAIIPIPLLIHSTQTPTNYTLLETYNASNLNAEGTAITIPQGTKNIKIDYNLSWEPVASNTNGFDIDAYNINIGGIVPPGTQNIIQSDSKGFSISKGQNKTGTYYFNDPGIKSLALSGNGIQGTINIYTSQ